MRLSDGEVRSWSTPPLLQFHAVQAFEVGADVVVDLCLNDGPVLDDFSLARLRAGAPSEAPRARHTRFVLSPGVAEAREEALPGRFDLPQIHPRWNGAASARFVWAASSAEGGSFFDRTIKLDHASAAVLLPVVVPFGFHGAWAGAQ